VAHPTDPERMSGNACANARRMPDFVFWNSLGDGPTAVGDAKMNAMKPMPSRLSALAKEERARDRTAAMSDYQAERLAVEAKTARLRAARLAREAADLQAKDAADPTMPTGKRKPKLRTASAHKS
jgi:hypothetical protein